MFARLRAAGLIVPALMTLVMLPVLIGLGSWQWQRMAWKQDLIAKIAARATAAAERFSTAESSPGLKPATP